MKRIIFALLAFVGIVGPYTQFVPWSMVNGFNVAQMISLAGANQISAGIAIDAVLAAIAFVVYILLEQKTRKVKYFWLPIIGIFVSGIAFAIPFYFFLREGKSEQN
jgi:hypothetical protein